MKLDVSGLKEGELVEGGVTLVQGSSSIRGELPGRVVFEAVGHLRHATIDHSAIKQHKRPGARRILCLPTRSIIAECQWSGRCITVVFAARGRTWCMVNVEAPPTTPVQARVRKMMQLAIYSEHCHSPHGLVSWSLSEPWMFQNTRKGGGSQAAAAAAIMQRRARGARHGIAGAAAVLNYLIELLGDALKDETAADSCR